MDLLLYGVPSLVALAATIKAGPVVWGFIIAVARLPHMTESIWAEFGRNGGSTTRDRIEEIARQVATTSDMQRDAGASLDRHMVALDRHTASDSIMFQLIADRLTSMERFLGNIDTLERKEGKA